MSDQYSTTRRAFVTGLLATAAGCNQVQQNPEPATDTTQTGTSTPETTTRDENTETSTPEQHPGTLLVDFKPAVDEEVRQNLGRLVRQIKNSERKTKKFESQLTQWYTAHGLSSGEAHEMAKKQVKDILERETPDPGQPGPNSITESYSTEETYDDVKFDEPAFEYWHDGDYAWLGFQNAKQFAFVETLDQPQYFQDVRRREGFDFETFSTTGDFETAIDQIHPYLLAFEALHGDGFSSAEDHQYSTLFQEAFDRYTDFETYFWDIEMAGHGNGLFWNQKEDSIRVMEPVPGTDPEDNQLHPKVENSNYLDPGSELAQKYWHPLRFGKEYREDRLGSNFSQKKNFAGSMFASISISADDGDHIDNANLGLTTGYVADIADKMRNYSSNSIDFETIKNQSHAYNKLARNSSEEGDMYVVGGTVEDPFALQVEDQQILDAVETDQEGKYDNIDQVAEHTDEINGSVTLEDVNQILGGQNTTTAAS